MRLGANYRWVIRVGFGSSTHGRLAKNNWACLFLCGNRKRMKVQDSLFPWGGSDRSLAAPGPGTSSCCVWRSSLEAVSDRWNAAINRMHSFVFRSSQSMVTNYADNFLRCLLKVFAPYIMLFKEEEEHLGLLQVSQREGFPKKFLYWRNFEQMNTSVCLMKVASEDFPV